MYNCVEFCGFSLLTRQSRTQGSKMVDLVLRIDLAQPITSVDSVKATVVCSLGAVSVDCGPGNGKVTRRLEVPLSSSGFECKWYRDANAVVLVLPVHRSEDTVRAGAVVVPVQECAGPVLEVGSPDCEIPDSSVVPPVATPKPHIDAPKTGQTMGVSTPSSWHEEASYKALYAAIERSRANIEKAASTAAASSVAAAPVSASAASMAVSNVATKEIKRNDPCVCGSGRKYKQCHGKE